MGQFKFIGMIGRRKPDLAALDRRGHAYDPHSRVPSIKWETPISQMKLLTPIKKGRFV